MKYLFLAEGDSTGRFSWIVSILRAERRPYGCWRQGSCLATVQSKSSHTSNGIDKNNQGVVPVRSIFDAFCRIALTLHG